MAGIRLDQVIVGIGNVVYDQFHRENRIELDAHLLNKAVEQRFAGGITADTVNALAISGGGLAANHGGVVNVEGGWNQRRGLALIKITITENSLAEEVMSVLGYLVGGSATALGMVPDDVLFVPVRSWTMATTTAQGTDYLPTTKRAISESSQFLMSDPDMMRDLQAVRPIDVINYGFGALNHIEEERPGEFNGVTNTSLGNAGIIISKSGNLNPIASAQSIMNHAARVSRNQVTYNSLSENMAAGIGNMRETETYEHPFLSMMMSELGLVSYAGFIGFTFEELRRVFMGFDRVMLPPSDRNTAETNHMLDSNQLGGADYHELIANELAFITLHSMLDLGLLYVEFVASNNLSKMGVNNGDIYWESGSPAGVLPNDPDLYNRTEALKDYIASTFFQRYALKAVGPSSIIDVSVKMNVFGETTVEIVLNGNYDDTRKFTFTSYCINRTSSNIAAGEKQRQMATNHVENLQQYFIQG